jgi:hypothetical protein
MLKGILTAVAVGMLISAAANATPITTPPPTLSAVGDVTAIYVYANADHTSNLNEIFPASFSQIFCNHPNGSCLGNNSGDTMDLGVQSGAMEFGLDNLTAGLSYLSDTPDSDGNYHVLITSNFADFGIGALPGGADSVITNLLGMGKSITYIGWEDLTLNRGSDFDYNDLIFAFANTTTRDIPVPEPLTVSLVGAGLVGATWLRRRLSKRA